MSTRNLIGLLFQLTSVVYLTCQVSGADYTEGVRINLPGTKRTEGRITLEYVRSNATIKHELAFSEVIDWDTKRSKTSIGYISYEPKVYYSRGGNIMTVNEDGKCLCLKQLGWKFVPELDWFLELTYTKEEMEKAMPADKAHQIGPSGIVTMLFRGVNYDRVETYRNVECNVATARYDRQKAKEILLEEYYPNVKMFDDPSKVNVFTMRETVKNAVNAKGETFSATMTIDYFYIKLIDKTNIHHIDKLEEDLNLPFGKGCGEFVTPTHPRSAKQSFIMSYRHQLAKTSISLAYDHEANYLRKEILGRSVSIWDLDEDLLYHEDQQVGDRMLPGTSDTQVPFDSCSVMRVSYEESSGSKLRVPYKKYGASIDVVEFLGATDIAYLGQTTVRELPCQVFEATLNEPPRVFDIEPRHEVYQAADDFDYIVQFHIFKTNPSTANTNLEQIVIVGDQFWPARITLTKRYKPTGRTMLLDRLEITDFHWGLYGWTKKPSELFMLPECFNDEDEQLRINLALSATNNYSPPDTLKTLRHNKYQLELALLGTIFEKLDMSRLHLTEFQLELRPHDVLANLVISDRDEDKELTYFGPGELPSLNSYLNNRVVLRYEADDDDSESTCVLLASHVSQISMAIYCPRRGTSKEPTCTAIFGEASPAIKQPANETPSGTTLANPFAESESCQVYRYESRNPPRSATRDVEKVKKGLTDLSVEFTADSNPKMKVQCKVEDFGVSRELQLITISNYKYAVANANNNGDSEASLVRTYETVTYDSLGDCTKMCNLDASCKSYSFCSDASVKPGKCVLSSLDLRQTDVENQLVHAPALKDNQVVVYDEGNQKGAKNGYTLDLRTGCNIYEKNFLSAFTQTEEILRIEPEMASSFITKPSASECARWVEGLEMEQNNYKSSMFAYCAGTNTCLADENLFVSLNGTQKDVDEDDEKLIANAGAHELSCQIYRRRYQTYFHISTMVIKPKPQEVADEHWLKQTELQFNTVEQCARACWDSFGHNCLSFDFCTPLKCTLNLLDQSKPLPSGDLAGEVEHEVRSACLHYERDLKWDQLRRDHLLGHHNPLGPIQGGGSNGGSGGGFVKNFFLILVTGVLFVVGLAVGRVFNDRLENVSILRRRTSMEPYGTLGGGDSFGAGSSVSRSIQRISSKFNIENEIYEDPEAIRMEEFGQRQDASTDELNKSSEDNSSTANDSNQSPANSNKPGYIDVPNLMQV